jgi:hypothetical protein
MTLLSSNSLNQYEHEMVSTPVQHDHHLSIRMAAETLNMGVETERQIIIENKK